MIKLSLIMVTKGPSKYRIVKIKSMSLMTSLMWPETMTKNAP